MTALPERPLTAEEFSERMTDIIEEFWDTQGLTLAERKQRVLELERSVDEALIAAVRRRGRVGHA